jgi:hypothetical protein
MDFLAGQVITDARVYFQPAVDWRGEGTVRSHPLAHIAAVVRRRASLRPTGAILEALTASFSGVGDLGSMGVRRIQSMQ